MNKTDFMHRTVTLEGETFHDADGENRRATVTRTRTTNGFAAIKIQFAGGTIEFDSDLAEGYEQAARNLAGLLDEICDEPCTIPPLPQPVRA